MKIKLLVLFGSPFVWSLGSSSCPWSATLFLDHRFSFCLEEASAGTHSCSVALKKGGSEETDFIAKWLSRHQIRWLLRRGFQNSEN